MFRRIFLVVIALSAGGFSTFAACDPITGAEQVLSNPQLHWIFVGEIHGSNESPATFFDLVCEAIRRVTISRSIENCVRNIAA